MKRSLGRHPSQPRPTHILMVRGKCSKLALIAITAVLLNMSLLPLWLSLGGLVQLQEFLPRGGDKFPTDSSGQVLDVTSVPSIEPVFIGQLNSTDVPYLVSFPWWDGRTRKPNYVNKKPIWANPTVMEVQRIIADTGPDDIYVDVGANVGFMSNYAINSKRPVYAIEPIQWNIAKIAEGINANLERGWANPSVVRDRFHLYHAAAGSEAKPVVDIIRPADHIGRFDAASMSREALSQKDVVTEHIPMITVDSLIPDDMNVGVVKIDVQGHEYGVLLGMKKLLGRKVGFPKYVFYENEETLAKLAGFNHEDCERLLSSFGYKCERVIGGDMECMK